jgi:ribosomal-protein-alanine N-acetyltransferase
MIASDAALALRIRSCGVQHAGELARLHSDLFDTPWDAETFQELLAVPGTLAFVAVPPAVDRPAAATSGTWSRIWGLVVGRVLVDEAEILTLGVASRRRRLGIAGRLVEKLCRVAGKRGAQRLFLEVAESNGPARALYSRLGFEVQGRRKGYYERAGAPAEDALNLCLPLARFAPRKLEL